MGIDDLDKTWWERNVSEPYLKEHYEEHPLLTIGAEHIGGGISDFFTEKAPNLAKYYWGKDSKAYPKEYLVDAAKHLVNLGYDIGDYGLDLGLNTATLLANTPAYAYNLATIPQNLVADHYGIEGLRAEPIGKGWNAAGTWLQDTISDVTGWEGSGMKDEAKKYHTSYQPPALTDDEGNVLRDDEGKGTADHDLSKWTLYQDWKRGSGTDFRALERESIEASNKHIDQWVKGEGSVQSLMNDFDKHFWYEKLTEDDRNYYDKEKMFASFYNNQLDWEKDYVKNRYELSKTGDDFGKWISQKYQNDMVSKYGRYDLVDDINFMSRDISPFAGVEVNFNLANDDWINAMKGGKTVDEIGAPNEFDYGAFDRESGVGINEWVGWQPFEHGSEEAKEFYESGPLFAAEILASGRLSQAPQRLTKALSKGKKGRIAREIFPGLLQNQAGWGLGKPKKFGFEFKDNRGAKRVANWLINTPINWARPKGGQAAFAIAAGERD